MIPIEPVKIMLWGWRGDYDSRSACEQTEVFTTNVTMVTDQGFHLRIAQCINLHE